MMRIQYFATACLLGSFAVAQQDVFQGECKEECEVTDFSDQLNFDYAEKYDCVYPCTGETYCVAMWNDRFTGHEGYGECQTFYNLIERLADEDCEYDCTEVASCEEDDYSHIGTCTYSSCTSSCDTGMVCFVDYEFKGLPGQVNRADCWAFEMDNADYWVGDEETNEKCRVDSTPSYDCSNDYVPYLETCQYYQGVDICYQNQTCSVDFTYAGNTEMNSTDCETFENVTCEFYGTCEEDDGSGDEDGDDSNDWEGLPEDCELSECDLLWDCTELFGEYLETCTQSMCMNSCSGYSECWVDFYAWDGTAGLYDCETFEEMADDYMNGGGDDDDDWYDDCNYTCGQEYECYDSPYDGCYMYECSCEDGSDHTCDAYWIDFEGEHQYASCDDYWECHADASTTDDDWQHDCYFVECYDMDEYYEDGNCWMEECGYYDDPCGRYSCTLWKYDERADYWDYSECPEEEGDFFEDAEDFISPFFDIVADTVGSELPNYCPNDECAMHYQEQVSNIAQDTVEDIVDVEDVAWTVDDFLADEEGVDAAKQAVSHIEDSLDVDLSVVHQILDSENHEEVFDTISGLVDVFTEGFINEGVQRRGGRN